MATTNAQQWNPAAINQETDASYTGDSNRTGGWGTDAIVPSPVLNKFMYQTSTYVAALGLMMATKGYTNSDASLSVLAAVMANIVMQSDLAANIVVVGYSPTPVFGAAKNNGFQMTLSGNVTSSTITGVSPGQLLAFYFAQDSVGGRTVAWPSGFVGALQPDPTPSSVSIQMFRADLSGTPRAVTGMMSNNGVFWGPLSAASITLATGAPAGKILAGNGTSFVASGTPLTSNINGSYRIGPDGTIEAWGTITVGPSGSAYQTATITYPVAFSTPPVLTVNSVGITSSGDSATPLSIQIETSGATSALIYMAKTVVAGAGGGNIDQTFHLNWHAIGN